MNAPSKEQTAKEIRKLEIEQLRRLKEEAYRYYEPTGKIEEFLGKAYGGKYFVTLLSAANGIGKTFSMANSLAHLIWGVNNKWFQQPLMKEWKYPKRIRICSHGENVKAIVDTLKEVFPKGKYTTNKNGRNFDSYFKTNNGWQIWIMTYDQDPMQFEGISLGLVWQDEPPPQVIHKANISRLRLGGICIITATPLTGSAWMYDEIISNPDNEKGSRAYVEADVESACKQHGVRGFLEHDQILKMVEQYDDEDKQARIYGKFQHLTGLIFKNFSRRIHVIPPFEINERDFTVYEELDPHPRNPDAVVWVAVDRKGTKYLVDEMYESGTTEEIAERIKRKASQYRVHARRMDPWAFSADQHTEKSLATRLSEYGLNYLPSSKKRALSDRRISEAFNYVEAGGQVVKPPELYVFDTCQRAIWEIERYRWDEWTGKAKEKHNDKPKPVDKDDHLIEGLGRALFQEPQFFEKINIITQAQLRENLAVDDVDPYA